VRLIIERDGARLFSITLGSGPDVVLLHPTPVHHGFWLPVAELLASHYRLTLVDLRGHGQSTAGSGPITMEKLAEDVHAVLAALTVTQATFVGCSIGGYVIYEYWRRFPQEVASIALICGKPQPDSAESIKKRTELMELAQQPGGLGRFFDFTAEMALGKTAQQRQPGICATARAMMDAMPLDTMLAVQQGLMQRRDSVPTLKTISVPVCAVAGGEDETSTPLEMRVIADNVPNAEFHLLPDAGHYAPLEQPRAVAEILGDFLSRHHQEISVNNGAGLSH
jgi:3-oxoadipate enol-lactonase